LVVALDGWRGGAHLGHTGGGGGNRPQTHYCKNGSHLTHAATENTDYIKTLDWFKPFFFIRGLLRVGVGV
jgi:peptide methionine sulfoxide reductase MsrB